MKDNATVFPKYLYLIKNDDDEYEWYDNDPFLNPDSKTIDIYKALAGQYGEGSIGNPLQLKIKAGIIERTQPFLFKHIAAIQGGAPLHLQDYEGCFIDILPYFNQDERYPINAVVLNADAEVIGTRQYSRRGECKDNNEKHRLIVVEGKSKYGRKEIKDIEESKDKGDADNQ